MSGFPEAFLWGAATSAYSIEGSPLADGAGASIWHRFSHTPGRIPSGDTGDVACDHYHRWREDVALMRGLGLGAYRFSIAWGRVLPRGTGTVNVRGLDFYQRLVDELLESGIVPLATLHHLDLPEALEDRGGWLHRDSASWFAEYASRVVRTLDDRVPLWATLADPWTLVDGGYIRGVLAPGRRNRSEAARVTHQLLLAHAGAVEAYRAEGRHEIGLIVDLGTEDSAAAAHRQYLDPVFLGRYPEEMEEVFVDAWPLIPPADLERIRIPIDFLGVDHDAPSAASDDPGAIRASAEGLSRALSGIEERYGKIPLYVTTTGPADPSVDDEEREDPRRIAYLEEHLEAIGSALRAGVEIRGVFVRPLLDGFEWNHGLSRRLGIVHVDHAMLRRTPKASARSYADVIRTGGGRATGVPRLG